MEQKARTLLSALVEAQDAVESNRPLRPIVVKRILDELIRTRRLLAANEQRMERERRKHEGVDVHGDGRAEGTASGEGEHLGVRGVGLATGREPQGTASGEGEHLGRQGSNVDPERG